MAASLSSEATRPAVLLPMLIADAIAKAITARRPKTRYAVG